MRAEDWIELALAGKGSIPLARLLETAVPLDRLRRVASRHGLKPKGGFRVEKATARQLGDVLAEAFGRLEPLRAEVAALLGPPPPAATSAPAVDEAAAKAIAQLERRVARLEQQAEREAASATRARQSKQDAVERRERAERRVAELEATSRELLRRCTAAEKRAERLEAQLVAATVPTATKDRGSLETRYQELLDKEAAARRTVAELVTRVRELERELGELESCLPRGQRERRRQARQAIPSEPQVTLLPRFTDEFFRCVQGLETEHERKVHAAVARLVLNGFDYPGLHAKALKGMGGLWSIRAGDHVRVFLTRDGDSVLFEAAVTREEQPTYLKKRKDS